MPQRGRVAHGPASEAFSFTQRATVELRNGVNSMDLTRREPSSAQTIAGRAVLLEIGAKLGVIDTFLSQKSVNVGEAARAAGLERGMVAAYYAALAHAGLARRDAQAGDDGAAYVAAPDFSQSLNECGYVLWGLVSCAPLLANALAFARDLPLAVERHPRDGEHVARTSRYMGEQDFYPPAERAVVSLRPRRIVDLGSGTCGLLIRCLRQLPEAAGVGIDLNGDACAKARDIVAAAGMDERIRVVEAPIQSLVSDPAPLEGAEVIHGGFVFHDLMPEEEATLEALLRTFRRVAPRAAVIVVDAVPYAPGADEQAFSAAFTFLHSHFMGRRLMPEGEWRAKLLAAGYASVDVERLGISGGRIFTARA